MKAIAIFTVLITSLMVLPPHGQAQSAVAPKFSIDMTTVLHDENGDPVPDTVRKLGCHGDQCPPLTLGWLILHKVAGPDPSEPEKQIALYLLANAIKDETAAVLNADQVSAIKKKMTGLGAVLLAQVYHLLDPNFTPPEVKP